VAAYKSSLKNTGKMNLQPILNKNSPHAHMMLEFDVVSIAGKFVKYVVHLFKKKN
jgi:hypothetical protein